MTLKEKVEAAAEEGDDVDQQAEILKDKMTSAEKSQVWGTHQTWLKSHPLEKEEFDKKNKKEKGVAAALWLMQVESKKYIHTSKEVSAKELWKKQDTWETEKQMLKHFTWEEFQAHQTSGRIVSRPDPVTWGCWQYKDMFSWSGEVQVARGKKWQSGGEYEPGAEHFEQFDRLYNYEAGHRCLQTLLGRVLEKTTLGKAKALEKAKPLGKGKASPCWP